MKKFLVIRNYEEKDYLYSIERAADIELACERIERKLINSDFKDVGIFTITPLTNFEYKGNKMLLPEGIQKQSIIVPPVDQNPFDYLEKL